MAFQRAIVAAGLSPPKSIVWDGKLHRFASDGSCGDDAGWYVAHSDGVPSGAFGCWRRGISRTWWARSRNDLSAAEKSEMHCRVAIARKARDEAGATEQAECRSKSKEIWDDLPTANREHAYLAKKKVGPHGIRQDRERLVIPVRDIDGTLHGLQFIAADGEKRFLPGTTKKGHFHHMGKLGEVVIVAEGYATAASVHETTGHAVVVAFDAGNLKPVAEAIRQRWPDGSIIIAGDHDRSGVGQDKARAAAAAAGGKVAIPEKPGDWNDVHVAGRLDASRIAFERAIACVPTDKPDDEAVMERLAGLPPEQERKSVKPNARFARTGTGALMAMVFPPIRWIVPGYVPEGLSILAGRQKLGKTWLAIDWAVAVACGGFAMGSIACEQGNVLYVDLENGKRRIQRRIGAIFPNARPLPDLSRLEWTHEAPMLNRGFLEALEDWRLSVPKPRMVVIDVFQRIKPAGNANQNAYENDYSILTGLQAWATEHGIAVVLLHHTKKGGAHDPLEALSGSNGISACADTTLVLDRDQNGITLYVRGRDVDEKESAMKFTAGLWDVAGEAVEVRRSSERGNILAALEQAAEPMSPTELADLTGMKNGNIRKLLFAMAKVGEVQKSGHGRYMHPKNAAKSGNIPPPGNSGNAVTFGRGNGGPITTESRRVTKVTGVTAPGAESRSLQPKVNGAIVADNVMTAGFEAFEEPLRRPFAHPAVTPSQPLENKAVSDFAAVTKNPGVTAREGWIGEGAMVEPSGAAPDDLEVASTDASHDAIAVTSEPWKYEL